MVQVLFIMACMDSPHPTPNAFLVELQVNYECHKIAMLLSVQMVAGVCVCLCQWVKKREDRVAQK